MKDLALRALDAVARRGVTYADVRAVDSRQRDISTRNGKTGHRALMRFANNAIHQM
jgi:predicted Zn-dependent protease